MSSERIENADGTPLFEGDGADLQSITIADVLPTEVHGFSVTFAIGPYPADAPHSHRRALYATLKPQSEKARLALRYVGRDAIEGHVPLTPEGVLDIEADEKVREHACRMALAPALELARQVDES